MVRWPMTECLPMGVCSSNRLSAVVVVRCGVGHNGDQLKALNLKITLDALFNRNSWLQLTEVLMVGRVITVNSITCIRIISGLHARKISEI